MDTPADLNELREAVLSRDAVRTTGGGSKPNLSRGANLSLAAFRGVVEYDPCEYTITARAGTPLTELQGILADKGQYLPFDPPLAERGATLGGTVAAGLSGSGAFRHGVVRDFLLGVRFVTGDGQIVFGGGKVVKNAAGFDFPKLMAGALGELGVLAELTLKVFPRPERVATLEARYDSRAAAAAAMRRLALSQVEPACLDLDSEHRLYVRLAGAHAALDARIARARTLLGHDAREIDDEACWRDSREFAWLPPDALLVKVGGSFDRLAAIVDAADVVRHRFALAGHVAWLACPVAAGVASLAERLRAQRLAGLVLLGGEAPVCVGRSVGDPLFARLRDALDPQAVFARSIVVQELAHAASD